MSKGKGWDLTSGRSLASAAEWIRKGADANLVLVVRGQRGELEPDFAFAVHPAISPADAVTMVEVSLPELQEQLAAERARAKEDARLKELADRQRAAGRYVRDAQEGLV